MEVVSSPFLDPIPCRGPSGSMLLVYHGPVRRKRGDPWSYLDRISGPGLLTVSGGVESLEDVYSRVQSRFLLTGYGILGELSPCQEDTETSSTAGSP